MSCHCIRWSFQPFLVTIWENRTGDSTTVAMADNGFDDVISNMFYALFYAKSERLKLDD